MDAAEKVKGKARGKPFPKGMPGGPGRGHKKPKSQVGEDMAADMRRAYTTAETPDDPPGVKRARELLHKDYERFMMLYVRVAPVVQKVASDATPEPEVVAVGEKEKRVVDVIEELLSRWEERNGEASPAAG